MTITPGFTKSEHKHECPGCHFSIGGHKLIGGAPTPSPCIGDVAVCGGCGQLIEFAIGMRPILVTPELTEKLRAKGTLDALLKLGEKFKQANPIKPLDKKIECGGCGFIFEFFSDAHGRAESFSPVGTFAVCSQCCIIGRVSEEMRLVPASEEVMDWLVATSPRAASALRQMQAHWRANPIR